MNAMKNPHPQMAAERRYRVELTETQLRTVAHAVEDWHRFLCGDCTMAHARASMDGMDGGKPLTFALHDVERHINPELDDWKCYDWAGSHCPRPHQKAAIEVSYYAYRQLLHRLAILSGDARPGYLIDPPMRSSGQGPEISVELCQASGEKNTEAPEAI